MRAWRTLAAVGIGLFMWRLLPTDPPDAGFNIYRQGPGGALALVNDKPVTDSTNLVDAQSGAGRVSYVVEALADHQKSHVATACEKGANYVSIPMHGNEIPRKVWPSTRATASRFTFRPSPTCALSRRAAEGREDGVQKTRGRLDRRDCDPMVELPRV